MKSGNSSESPFKAFQGRGRNKKRKLYLGCGNQLFPVTIWWKKEEGDAPPLQDISNKLFVRNHMVNEGPGHIDILERVSDPY